MPGNPDVDRCLLADLPSGHRTSSRPRGGPATRSGRRPRGGDRPGAGLALQRRAQRQRGRSTPCSGPGHAVRLGRRRPVLRPQRLPDGPAGPHASRPRTGRFDGRRFTARRLLKLWPVLYVFLAVQALVGAEPVDVLPLAERPARAELRGHVAGAPVVARGRGALLPAAGRPVPAVRPAPRVRRGCSPASWSASWSAALALRGLGRRDGRQRGPAAVAHPLPRGLAGGRRAARRAQRALRPAPSTGCSGAVAVGRGASPPASRSSPPSARRRRSAAPWATPSPT